MTICIPNIFIGPSARSMSLMKMFDRQKKKSAVLNEPRLTVASVSFPESAGNWTKLDEEGKAYFELDLAPYKNGDGWQPTVVGRRHLIEAVVMEALTSKKETGYSDRSLFERNLYKVISYSQREIRPGYPAVVTVGSTTRTQVSSKSTEHVLVHSNFDRSHCGIPNKTVSCDALLHREKLILSECGLSFTFHLRISFSIQFCEILFVFLFSDVETIVSGCLSICR